MVGNEVSVSFWHDKKWYVMRPLGASFLRHFALSAYNDASTGRFGIMLVRGDKAQSSRNISLIGKLDLMEWFFPPKIKLPKIDQDAKDWLV